MSKKRTKKYNPHKSDDFIPPVERLTSTFAQFFVEVDFNLKHKITYRMLIDDFVQLHRLTFLFEEFYPDTSCQNVRDCIEKYLDKIEQMPNEELNPLLDNEMKIHYHHKQLLLEMLRLIKAKLITISSRKIYGEANKVMLVNHNLYVGLRDNSVRKWVNRSDVDDALFQCRKREQIDEIARANKKGKLVYQADDGEIKIIERDLQ